MAFFGDQTWVNWSNGTRQEDDAPISPFDTIGDYLVSESNNNTHLPPDRGFDDARSQSERPYREKEPSMPMSQLHKEQLKNGFHIAAYVDPGLHVAAYAGAGLHVDESKMGRDSTALKIDSEQCPEKYDYPEIPPKKRRKRWIVMIALLIVAIAVPSIVAPVVTTRARDSESIFSAPNMTALSTSIPGTLRPSTTKVVGTTSIEASHAGPTQAISPSSTRGVFNGTSLSVVPAYDSVNTLHLFFQRPDGEIQFTSRSTRGVWASARSIGVTDARNQTPLAVTFTPEGPGLNVFYVDTSDYVQSRVYTGDLGKWLNGTIGNRLIKVPTARTVAFSAIAGNVSNTTIEQGSTTHTAGGDLGLYVGAQDSLIHEHLYNGSTNQWMTGFTFPDSNGHSGAHIWPAHAVSSMHLVNDKKALQLWWKYDGNSTAESSTRHKNSWLKVETSPPIFTQNSSLCTTPRESLFQASNNRIMFYSFEYLASNRTVPHIFVLSNQEALPKTSIGCISAGIAVHVYYQVNGSDIIEARHNRTHKGDWLFSPVNIN